MYMTTYVNCGIYCYVRLLLQFITKTRLDTRVDTFLLSTLVITHTTLTLNILYQIQKQLIPRLVKEAMVLSLPCIMEKSNML